MINYSQLIGGAMLLMYKPSVVDSPSGRAPAKAPRWDLADTEGCGGGNSFSWCSWMFSGYVDIYRRKKWSVEPRGAHEGGGCAHPLRARWAPSWPPRSLLDVHSKSPNLYRVTQLFFYNQHISTSCVSQNLMSLS